MIGMNHVNLSPDSYFIRCINKIRSGYTRAKQHLFEKYIINSSECDCGFLSQSLTHIFFECSKFSD